MRAVLFLIYLCSFLLTGGPSAVANTNQSYGSFQHLEKSGQQKFSNADQGFVLIEDADFDTAEENHVSEDLATVFPSGKYTLSANWHTTSSRLFALHYQQKEFKNAPHFRGHTPIYITQRVLRI